jgi:hemoglobin
MFNLDAPGSLASGERMAEDRMSIASTESPETDVTTRADVSALLRRFYWQVLVDDVLAEPFETIRTKGLESHLPVMCDFWETVLFRAGLYQGSALRAHRIVHDHHALTAKHFLRWLGLWNATVDQMYRGTHAEQAKIQAARIAWAMHRRLTGQDNLDLDVMVRRQSAGRS